MLRINRKLRESLYFRAQFVVASLFLITAPPKKTSLGKFHSLAERFAGGTAAWHDSKSCYDKIESQSLYQLYALKLLELEPAWLRELATAAELTMHKRIKEWQYSSNHYEERIKIANRNKL